MRHFIFRAHAAAFGGQIIRPRNIVLEAPGASALPVTGGRCVAKIPAIRFDDEFSIAAASTRVEGLFADPSQFLAFTNHAVPEDSLTAVTEASAEVEGLVVGAGPRLTVGRLRAEVSARSPYGSGEPAIRIGESTAIEGVEINGHRLVVELDTAPFQVFDTHAKLLVAADDPVFVKASGDLLFMRTPREGSQPPPPAGRLIEACGMISATIVRSIRWDGPEYPNSQIIGNSVVLEPDFGRVFFGELLITEYSRRLTMIRFALGSNGGGSASAGDVCSNGMWSP